MIVLKFCH